MQVKTIRKTIQLKVEDWINSITDESLRKALYKDVIVTGGCITSLFLNEEVNDYDIYIRSYNTLERLMIYYRQDFPEYNITIFEGKDKQDLIHDLVEEYGDSDIKYINNQTAIAIRNLKENQIKYFIPNDAGGVKIDYEAIERDNKKFKKDTKYRPVFFSPNAISLSDDVQIIVRFWGEPDVIHTNYDFIHATNYWTFKDGLVTTNLALTSILTKQLMYQGSLYPVTSIIRTKKFINRKWRITAGEMFKMIYQASLLDLQNIDVLEEQLIGMDVAYFGALIEALRKIEDKSKLTTEYLFSIIDRIFDNADIEKTDDNE